MAGDALLAVRLQMLEDFGWGLAKSVDEFVRGGQDVDDLCGC
jgi:hypothetical protein